jgi:hypothetical protein
MAVDYTDDTERIRVVRSFACVIRMSSRADPVYHRGRIQGLFHPETPQKICLRGPVTLTVFNLLV